MDAQPRFLSPAFALTGLAQAALFAWLLRGPLFWAFHFEYALAAHLSLLALLGPWTLASFWPAPGVFAGRAGAGRSLARALVLVLIPLALAGGAQILVGTCDAAEGLAWYALLPVVGGLLVWALAAGCALLATRRRTAVGLYWLLVAAAALSVGARLYLGPSFRIYSVLLGYWPGIVYDEYVPIEPALWLARLEALLLTIALAAPVLGSLAAPWRLRRRWPLAASFFLAGFLACWLLEGPAGIHPSRGRLERELGLLYPGRRAQWVADAGAASVTARLPLLAARLDYQVGQVAGELALSEPPPLRVYLFASPEEKRRVIGAERTVVTRPWLGELYLHAGPRAERVLRHEAVHLVAARWALAGVGISPNVALLEGLAVSLAGGLESAASPAALARAVIDREPDFDLGKLLTGGGFWTFSPRIAYPLAGAFVDFLRAEIPTRELARLYRWGRPPGGPSISELIARWRAKLQRLPPPAPLERALARRLLEARPIQQRRCAHEVAECLHGGSAMLGATQLARARALDPLRGDLKLFEARRALAGGASKALVALLPGDPDTAQTPTSVQVAAAGEYARWLARRGEIQEAARWAGYVRRWSDDLRLRWEAARIGALGPGGGARGGGSTWQSAGGSWALRCPAEGPCAETGRRAGALLFANPLDEFSAALEQYERALEGREFPRAALWAERMEAARGTPEFLKGQARRAGDEARWLAKNFRWYEKGVALSLGE